MNRRKLSLSGIDSLWPRPRCIQRFVIRHSAFAIADSQLPGPSSQFHSILVDRGGHGVFRPIAQEHPAAWRELMEFLIAGDMEDIPSRLRLSPSQSYDPPSFSIDD